MKEAVIHRLWVTEWVITEETSFYALDIDLGSY